MFTFIKKWADEKIAYLSVKEIVRSSEAAKQHLSLLDAFDSAFKGQTESSVPALQNLGKDIRAAVYETVYSRWVYEHPEEITV